MTASENITFKIHMPMEFLYSLFAIGTGKHFLNMIREFDLESDEKIIDTTTQMINGLSNYLNQELKYFFDLPGLGYILYKYVLRCPELTTVEQFINKFKEIEPNDLTFEIVKSVCKNNIPEENTIQYETLKRDTNEMIKLVKQVNFQDMKRKQLVFEILENPEETKQRLNLLLSQFYIRCFSPIEASITALISEYIQKYQLMLNNNPKEFMEKYFNFNLTNNTNIIIHLSFFKYASWHMYSLCSKDSVDWFILGIYSDLLLKKAFSAERFATFFKSISDPNRIEILKLLCERPWFGQELAEKLNITPATVSYHMAFLQRIGAVTFIKSENRSYYSINNSKFIKTLEDFTSFIKKKSVQSASDNLAIDK